MTSFAECAWQDLTDDELVERLGTGSVDDCLAELDRRYGQRIFRFVQRILHDEHAAQDVVLEVFERVFLKSHLYQLGSNFRAWIFEIARNQALTALRARRRTPRPISSLAKSDQDVDPLRSLEDWRDPREPESRELLAELETAIEDLPEKYRDAFELCERQGLSYSAAGRCLGIPVGTVAIRLMRARRRLYQTLSSHFDRLRRPPACFQ